MVRQMISPLFMRLTNDQSETWGRLCKDTVRRASSHSVDTISVCILRANRRPRSDV